MEIGQGGFGTFGIFSTPVHEQADADAAEHAQHPDGVAMTHAAAIFISTDIQALVQAGFHAPITALGLQPLLGPERLGRAAGQQVLQIGFVAQALAQQGGALLGGRKAGLLGVDGLSAERAGFPPAPVLFLGARPVGRQRHRRGKKAARLRAVFGSRFAATVFDWL